MKPTQKAWKTPPDGGPFNPQFQEYDEFIGQVRKERNAWRFAAFCSFGFVGIALVGIIYLGSLPSIVPHVIEVASWGEAQNIGPVGKSYYSDIVRSRRSIEYYLRTFIKNTRSISTDPEIIKERLTTAFRSVTTRGYNQLQADVAGSGIFTRSQSGRVDTTIHSILLVTESSYQIDWTETSYTKNGRETGKRYFRGLFNVALAEPTKEQINANPLGIFIDGYDIQEIEVINE